MLSANLMKSLRSAFSFHGGNSRLNEAVLTIFSATAAASLLISESAFAEYPVSSSGFRCESSITGQVIQRTMNAPFVLVTQAEGNPSEPEVLWIQNMVSNSTLGLRGRISEVTKSDQDQGFFFNLLTPEDYANYQRSGHLAEAKGIFQIPTVGSENTPLPEKFDSKMRTYPSSYNVGPSVSIARLSCARNTEIKKSDSDISAKNRIVLRQLRIMQEEMRLLRALIGLRVEPLEGQTPGKMVVVKSTSAAPLPEISQVPLTPAAEALINRLALFSPGWKESTLNLSPKDKNRLELDHLIADLRKVLADGNLLFRQINTCVETEASLKEIQELAKASLDTRDWGYETLLQNAPDKLEKIRLFAQSDIATLQFACEANK